MANKKQDTKEVVKPAAEPNENKKRYVAKSNSGFGTVLNVKIGGKDESIIHGEVLLLDEKQLLSLKMASSSWTYEEVKGDK